jgi:hypothetical protein
VRTLLQCKSNKYYLFWVFDCSLRHPACNAHAPYCHLWSATLHNIFPHYVMNYTFSKNEKLLDIKGAFWFSLQILFWNISHSKNWERYDQKCILVFMRSTRHSCPILMKLEFSRQIFQKHSNVKFRKTPSSGSRFVLFGRTDGQTWRSWQSSRLSQFCERDIKKPLLFICRIIYVMSETCLITSARLVNCS